jgi:hypothetical protein
MARIRSIHPALFTDEAFAGLSMASRVLLLGLWTEADDQGVFDWKPITIKMRIMPVDNVDVPSLLMELEDADVIRGFVQDGKSLGAIRNFCKFQRPKTPKYRALKSAEIRNYVASSYPVTETTEPKPASFPQKVEIPPQREEGGGKREEKEVKQKVSRSVADATRPGEHPKFEEFWRSFPRRDGPNPRKPAEQKFSALTKTGVDPETMVAGAKQLAIDESRRGNVGTRFIPQAVTWLSQQRWSDHAAAAFTHDDGCVNVVDTLQLEAWDEYGMKTRGKPYPRDKLGAWRFPSKWPPGYEANIAADVERLMERKVAQ